MKTAPYCIEKKVSTTDLDALAHVNNVVYLQWVQEAAQAHWEHLIAPQSKAFGRWVVRSHHITYKQPAHLGDNLQIETYVTHTRGMLSERVVEIYKKEPRTLLAQCRTQWCYLDPQTLKPTAIPKTVTQLLG